jgi:hypothetical protein
MIHPDAERIDAPRNGGSYLGGGATKLVLHTTEGFSIEDAVDAYQRISKKTGKPIDAFPHFTVDAQRRRAAQHVDTDVAAIEFLAEFLAPVFAHHQISRESGVSGWFDTTDMPARWRRGTHRSGSAAPTGSRTAACSDTSTSRSTTTGIPARSPSTGSWRPSTAISGRTT